MITEISTVNHDVILDDSLAPSDWVELYNRSERVVSLAGWRLAESDRPRRGWVFPGITLAPGTHLIVWASGNDRVSSAAGRRVNTRVTRQARHPQVVSDRDKPWPEYFLPARRVRVDIAVPDAGTYTLWMKVRTHGASGRVRVRAPGLASTVAPVPGWRFHHLQVGAEGSVRLAHPGVHAVDIIAAGGAVDVAYVALVRAGPIDDRYARHVHAGFRIRHGREGVVLVDPIGVVRDEVPPMDHAPAVTLQREPGTLAWRPAQPTPAGWVFHPGPDLLGTYPSVSPGPFRVDLAPPPGAEELRYTLDGSVPTAQSPRFAGSLELTKPTTLRLRGYSSGVPVTPVVTRAFWVGPLPPTPAVMVALAPELLSDPEIGIEPNNEWRRQRELPDDPALGRFRLTRSRTWMRERRQWIEPAHLLVLDRNGVLFDGRGRVRRLAHDGLLLRTPEPTRPARDLFGRELPRPGRSFILDEDEENFPSFDVIRAAGGVAPRTAWGLALINDDAPVWRILMEPVDDDFLRSRWGHARFDLLKGKPLAVKRGTSAAFDTLASRLRGGAWTETEVAPLVDLSSLIGLHLGTLFVAGRRIEFEDWQAYLAFDHGSSPPRLRAVAWDLDGAIWERSIHRRPLSARPVTWGGVELRSRALPALVVSRLLDTDPAFRDRYLREAERVLNHVLTPAWWEDKRSNAAAWINLDWAARITRAFAGQPAAVFRVLSTDLALQSPHVVRLEVVGRGPVTIDGYPYQGPYRGHYFVGATVELIVPAERREAFRHFTVNGRTDTGPILRLPVTEDLQITARFEE